MKSSTVRARLEPDLKEDAEMILEQLGLSTTEAIRIFFKQVQLQIQFSSKSFLHEPITRCRSLIIKTTN